MKKGLLKALCLVGILTFTIPVVGYCCYKASYNKKSVLLDDESKINRLFRAAGEGDIEVVKLLIKTGADVNAKDKNGKTPLHYAADNAEIAKLLIETGADVNARDKNGKTPLHYAADNAEVAKLLIETGADVNARDNNGKTPLHYAADNAEVAKLLIETGADVNARDNNGDTPLHYAAKADDIGSLLINNGVRHQHRAVGNVEVAKLLIETGADVNARDNNGDTPLHKTYYIVYHNGCRCITTVQRNDVAELLIEHGADQDVENNEGRKPGDFGKYKYFGNYLK